MFMKDEIFPERSLRVSIYIIKIGCSGSEIIEMQNQKNLLMYHVQKKL